MKNHLTQCSLLRILIILAVIGIIYDIFNSIVFPFGFAHPFSYFCFAKEVVLNGLKSMLISVLMILMYKFRFRVAFFVILALSIYHLFNYSPLIGRPISWLFGASTPLKMNIVLLLNLCEAIVGLLGVTLVVRDYIKSSRKS